MPICTATALAVMQQAVAMQKAATTLLRLTAGAVVHNRYKILMLLILKMLTGTAAVLF